MPAHREEIRVAGMSEPISHFTHVVRADRLVFVSGCVASDEQGRTVGGLGQLDRFLDPETEPVLAREEDFHNIKCTGRLAVHTPLLGRH